MAKAWKHAPQDALNSENLELQARVKALWVTMKSHAHLRLKGSRQGLEDERSRRSPASSCAARQMFPLQMAFKSLTSEVVCLENLANVGATCRERSCVAQVVCLPCKHLALCSFCSTPLGEISGALDVLRNSYGDGSACSICRGPIQDRMLIYMP